MNYARRANAARLKVVDPPQGMPILAGPRLEQSRVDVVLIKDPAEDVDCRILVGLLGTLAEPRRQTPTHDSFWWAALPGDAHVIVREAEVHLAEEPTNPHVLHQLASQEPHSGLAQSFG